MSRRDQTEAQLERTGLRMEYATIAWNAVEMVVAIALGIAARSLALVAFGFDTMIELFASGVVVWHLLHQDNAARAVTARALRLVSVAFIALSMAVAAGGIWALARSSVPDESPYGIAYLAVTVVVMLGLGLAKRRAGQRLASEPLAAEARMSILDAALALGVLSGLAVNAALGWWWADAVAALLVSAVALHEGVENWREAAELLEADETQNAENPG